MGILFYPLVLFYDMFLEARVRGEVEFAVRGADLRHRGADLLDDAGDAVHGNFVASLVSEAENTNSTLRSIRSRRGHFYTTKGLMYKVMGNLIL